MEHVPCLPAAAVMLSITLLLLRLLLLFLLLLLLLLLLPSLLLARRLLPRRSSGLRLLLWSGLPCCFLLTLAAASPAATGAAGRGPYEGEPLRWKDPYVGEARRRPVGGGLGEAAGRLGRKRGGRNEETGE